MPAFDFSNNCFSYTPRHTVYIPDKIANVQLKATMRLNSRLFARTFASFYLYKSFYIGCVNVPSAEGFAEYIMQMRLCHTTMEV